MRRLFGRFIVLAVASAAVLLGAALSAGRAGTRQAAPVVRVTERDFRITAPTTVHAGDVRLLVRNKGPEKHELIVVRVHRLLLPLRSDGLTVDEEALRPLTVGGIDGAEPGQVHELKLHLPPGRYVLFCNMAGHYLGGMHAQLVVR